MSGEISGGWYHTESVSGFAADVQREDLTESRDAYKSVATDEMCVYLDESQRNESQKENRGNGERERDRQGREGH